MISLRGTHKLSSLDGNPLVGFRCLQEITRVDFSSYSSTDCRSRGRLSIKRSTVNQEVDCQSRGRLPIKRSAVNQEVDYRSRGQLSIKRSGLKFLPGQKSCWRFLLHLPTSPNQLTDNEYTHRTLSVGREREREHLSSHLTVPNNYQLHCVQSLTTDC